MTTKNAALLSHLIKNESVSAASPKTGELISGKILEKAPKAVFVDLGPFGTGIIYGLELLNARGAIKNLNPGDEISAKVIDPKNNDGYAELSMAEASRQKTWEEIREIKEKREAFGVKITGANSGGLMAEIGGLKAFLPVSQLSNEHYPRVSDADKAKILDELKKFVGQELSVKILDFNPRSEKLIISEREISDQNVKESLSSYKVDDIIDGIISGVADFGAFLRFADNPKIEGLIHISELDHRLIENPKDVVKVGDAVKAKIIEIKDERVSLSLKALKTDPWLKVEEKYRAGMEVSGTVTKFNPFGAFITLDSDFQGLIHVSEFGGVEEMRGKIAVGQAYKFKIDSVKPAEKRIVLKLAK